MTTQRFFAYLAREWPVSDPGTIVGHRFTVRGLEESEKRLAFVVRLTNPVENHRFVLVVRLVNHTVFGAVQL